MPTPDAARTASSLVTLIINPLQQAPHAVQSTLASTIVLISCTNASTAEVFRFLTNVLNASFSC